MTSYNLYAPNGKELVYPHYLNFGKSEVTLVTSSDSLIQVGDELFVATKDKTPTGELVYSYFNKPKKVLAIIEQRAARGKHRKDITPIYQKVSI